MSWPGYEYLYMFSRQELFSLLVEQQIFKLELLEIDSQVKDILSPPPPPRQGWCFGDFFPFLP